MHLKAKGFIFFSIFVLSAGGMAADSRPDLRAKVDHAFERLAFGARPGEREEIARLGEAGLQNWIKLQLNPDSIDDSAVEELLAKHEILRLSSEELMSQYLDAKQRMNNPELGGDDEKKPDDIRKAWISAKLIRAVLSRRQLEEKLADFWFNHFNVDQRKGKDRWLFGPYERDAIRPHMYGKFIDLLRATARHPAMLFYLDNHLSRVADPRFPNKGGLNENYGRELLELHTLGVNGGYTQRDVTEAARVLTGWGISDLKMQPAFEFKSKWHDFGAKQVMNWEFKEGTGEEEGERLLQLLSESPATAKHISTQLIEAFVANPAPPNLVDRLSKLYLQTHGDLKSLYTELFASEEFWDKKYYGQLVKDHFQWVISVIRTLGGEVIWNNRLMPEFQNLGEPLYNCAPPTGYRLRPEDFINAGSLMQRLNMALRLSADRIDGVYLSGARTDTLHLRSPDDLIRELTNMLGLQSLSDSSRNALMSELSGEIWRLNNGEPRPFIMSRLLGLLLASPEFQRM